MADMNHADTLWLIPARGGSKGIPHKNIKPFCGKPLVTRAVEQALECASPNDTVFVSTDSPEIKETAEKSGIKIPFLRSEKNASDIASSYDVIIETLQNFKSLGKHFERVVLLQPTSPLRMVEDIKNTINLWSEDIDMAVTVTQARTNPYYNGFETDENGFLHISKGDGSFTRRQDAPDVWEYNGAVYVISVKSLEKSDFSGFSKIVPSPMPPSRSADLDLPHEWMVAEMLFSKLMDEKK